MISGTLLIFVFSIERFVNLGHKKNSSGNSLIGLEKRLNVNNRFSRLILDGIFVIKLL
jgi:hypothetical protein